MLVSKKSKKNFNNLFWTAKENISSHFISSTSEQSMKQSYPLLQSSTYFPMLCKSCAVL